MKIQMQLANGYRLRILKIMTDNPNMTEIDAVTTFVQQNFGQWITDNISNDYSFEDIRVTDFTVNFTHDDDGFAFLAKVGGRVIED